MWLPRPVYESLPYYYIAFGVAAGLASFNLDRWYWPEIVGACAALSVITGLVLWLKRRDYRQSRSRIDIDDHT